MKIEMLKKKKRQREPGFKTMIEMKDSWFWHLNTRTKWNKSRFSKCDHAKSDTYLENYKENIPTPRKKASRLGLCKCLLQSHYGRLLNNKIQKQINKWMHKKERKDRNQAFNQERSQIYSEMGLKCDKLSKPYWEN